MGFLKYGFLENKWGWFHGIGGAILALFIPLWSIFLIAILWEIIEYFTTDVKKVYGTQKRFFMDATGDFFLAIIHATLIKVAMGM